MILAMVPLGLISLSSYLVDNSYNSTLVLISDLGWLFFLPNSFYIITDFMHLNQDVLVNKRDNKFASSLSYKRGDPKFLFDSLLLLMTTVFGAIAGAISIKLFYEMLDVDNLYKYVVVGAVVILSSAGVYIGRFGRWNSWDAFIKPHKVIVDFIKSIATKENFKNFSIIIITMIVFQLLCLILVLNY
jgi:uncharacterized membrane protein